MTVTTIGIDCATDPARVGLALAQFRAGHTRVLNVQLGSRTTPPAAIAAGWLSEFGKPTLIALDAPLGWPVSLGRAPRR